MLYGKYLVLLMLWFAPKLMFKQREHDPDESDKVW